MRRTISAALLAALCRVCLAQEGRVAEPFYLAFNISSSPPEDYNITSERFVTTSERPVGFTRGVTQRSLGNWTWTVATHNVTNAAIPLDFFQVFGNGTSTPTHVEDSNIAYTTYSFSWPNSSQNINEAVAGDLRPGGGNPGLGNVQSASSCLFLFDAIIPQNTSDAWDGASSDCTSAFGEECVMALSNSLAGAQETCESPGFRMNPEASSACAGRFSPGAWIGREFGNSTMPDNDTALESGGVRGWLLSEPYAIANTTAYEAEANKLRVIAIANFEALEGGGSTMNREFLCNRPGPGLDSAAVSIRGGGLVSVVTVVTMLAVAWSST